MPSLVRTIERGLTAVVLGLLLVVGLLQGLAVTAYSVDLWFGTLLIHSFDAANSILLFAALLLVNGLVFHWKMSGREPAWRRGFDGEPVTAVVPVYNDADVLPNSVRSLVKTGYEGLEVLIVHEPDDDASREAGERLAAEHDGVAVMENQEPGSKAGALNTGVGAAETPLVAFLDADEVVPEGFFGVASSYLAAGHDVFQARRMPRSTGWLEGFCYAGYVIRTANLLPFFLIGDRSPRTSAVVMDRSVLDRVDGLRDVLTEDIDFAQRVYRQGIDVCRSFRTVVWMEAPHAVREYWGQRKRWVMGSIDVAVRAVTGGYGPPTSLRSVLATMRSLVPVVTGLTLFLLVAKFLLVALVAPVVLVLPLAVLWLVVYSVAWRDGVVRSLSLWGLLAPLAPISYAVRIVRCGFEYALSWDGEWFQVRKTG